LVYRNYFNIATHRLTGIEGSKIIHIYGAGLSGLTAAINLAREGYDVTVYEKEERAGGSGKINPSVHMTPLHFEKMKEYIGIDVKPCFSKLNIFTAHIYSKIVHFNPEYLYVTERGPQKTSLDYYLYTIARKEGINFEFSNPLTRDTLNSVPDNSIIAAGTYSGLCKYLKLRSIPFVHFDSRMKTECNGSFCMAYFDTYIGGYGYAYIATKDNLLSGEVDFFLNQPYEKYLQKFKNQLKKTKNIQFSTWSMVEDNYPEQVQLFKKAHGKNYLLAGALSGFHDPFFGFGVNSALVSGKIAATALIDKKRGMKEFKRFSEHLPGMYILSKIYRYIPFKDLVIPQLFRSSKSSIPIIGRNVQSIPGLTHEDCFKILHVE